MYLDLIGMLIVLKHRRLKQWVIFCVCSRMRCLNLSWVCCWCCDCFSTSCCNCKQSKCKCSSCVPSINCSLSNWCCCCDKKSHCCKETCDCNNKCCCSLPGCYFKWPFPSCCICKCSCSCTCPSFPKVLPSGCCTKCWDFSSIDLCNFILFFI